MKATLVGDAASGKTSLVAKFFDRPLACTPTIGVSMITTRNNLEIWDTAGEERYRSITPIYIRGSRVCILAYDASRFYNHMHHWYDFCLQYVTDSVFVCVGCKCDLGVYNNDTAEWAELVGIRHFFTSAKTGENVATLLNYIENIAEQPITTSSSLDEKSSTLTQSSKCCF